MRITRLASILAIVAALAVSAAAQNDRKAEAALQSALNKEFIDNNVEAAIKAYKDVIANYKANHRVAASALVRLAQAYEKLGNGEAQKAYERIVSEYGDQPAALAEAQSRLKALTVAVSRTVVKGLTKVPDTWQSLTADGRYLVGGNRIKDLATGKEMEIPGVDPWLDLVPSPDGNSVTFGDFDDMGAWELRLSSTNPSRSAQSTVLLHNDEYEYGEPFGWSADGKEVFALLERKDGRNLIAAIAVANGALRSIKRLEGYPNRLSLSPDGRYIAYDAPVLRDSPRNRDIFVLAVATGQETAVVESPWWEEMPVWTPDGKALVFKSERSGSVGLWTVRIIDGKREGAPEQLHSSIPNHEPLGFARDASYYFRTGGGQNIDVNIAAMDLDGGTVSATTVIERFSGRNSTPKYSPDGLKLAYLSGRSALGGFRTIVIRTLNTGMEREILTNDSSGPRETFAWFPDGESILFTAPGPGGERSFHRVDLNSGETRLVKDGISGIFPVVSPNGKTIFYFQLKGIRSGQQRIMSYDLETQREAQIFEGDISLRTSTGLVGAPNSDNLPIGRFALSPDGRQIAFALIEKRAATLTDPLAQDNAPPTLVTMSSSGGPVQKLRTPETLGLNTIQWSPDGKNVLVQRGSGQLFWVPIDGGEPRRIGTGTFPAVSSMRPDGKEIAMVMRSAGPPREVWVESGILPSIVATPDKGREDGNAGIYVASLDPATGRVLSPVPLSNKVAGRTCAPAWSPDGRYISFSRRRVASSNNDMDFDWVIRSIETGEERVFQVNSSDCWVTGVWFHDNNSLLTQSFVEPRDRGRLRRRDLSSGQVLSLNIPAYQTAMAVSLDDKTLYMTVRDPKTSSVRIVSVDLATGTQNLVWNSPVLSNADVEAPMRLALSPDGRTFALVLADSKRVRLVRVGSDGTGFKEVYSADAAGGATPSRSGLAWTRDNRSILFMDEGKLEQRLMRVSADGGKPEFTGLTIDNTRAVLDLSPDGRKIAFFSPRAPRISGPAGANNKR